MDRKGLTKLGALGRDTLLGSRQPMFASHLWARAAAVMSGGAEEPSGGGTKTLKSCVL